MSLPKSWSRCVRLLVLVPVFASGQSLEDPSLEELLQTPVETASRRAQPLVWSPANSIIISREQMDARHYVNLKDLLKDLPGVDVYDNFSEESRQLLAVRGSPGNSQFLILQDGQRISSFTGEPLSIDDNYPLFHAHRVEIVYGPASSLYGADAFTGIVNIITSSTTNPYSAHVFGSFGSDVYKYGAANLQAKLGETGVLKLRGSINDSNNSNLAEAYPELFDLSSLRSPYTGEVIRAERDNAYSHRSHGYFLNAEVQMGSGFAAGFDLRRFNHQTSENVRPEHTLYGPEAQLTWQMAYLRHRYSFSPTLRSETNARFSALRSGDDYQYENFYTHFVPAWKVIRNETFELRQELAWDITAAHNLIGGATWSTTHAAPVTGDLSHRPTPGQPLASEGYTIAGTDLPMPFINVDYSNLGGYVQLQSQWLPNLSSTVGVRVDVDSRFGGTINPRAGLVYQLTPKHTVKALYGEAFLAPSPYFQYSFFGEFSGVDPVTGQPVSDYYRVPNPDLEPMKARTGDLHYTGVLTQGLIVSASAYLSRVDHAIAITLSDEPTEFAGGLVRLAERAESIGQYTLYGGDAMVRYREELGPVSVDAWLSYSLSLGAAYSPEDGTRLELPYNTPHKLKGGVTVGWEWFQLTPKFRFASASTHSSFREDDATRRVAVPASTVVDLVLRVQDLGLKGLGLSVDLRNALDARYFQPGNLGPVNFAVNPQDARQLFVQADWRI